MTEKKSWYILFSVVILTVLILTQVMGQAIFDPSAYQPPKEKTALSEQPGLRQPVLKKTELRVVVSMKASEFTMLQQINQAFEKKNPEIKVILDNIADTAAYSDLKAAASSGSADVFLLDNSWVGEFSANGFLSNKTDEWFTNDVQANQFSPILKQLKWNKYIWGIPLDVDSYVLAWNKKNVAASKPANPPVSAEQLLEINKTVKDQGKDAAAIGLYVDPQDPDAFLSLIWSLGSTWPQEQSGAGGQQPSVAELLNSFYLLKEGGKQNPDSKTAAASERLNGYPFVTDQFDPWQQLKQGNITYMIAKASSYLEQQSDSLDVSFLTPASSSRSFHGAALSGRSFTISAYSRQIPQALLWIEEVVSQANQVDALHKSLLLPAWVPAYGMAAGPNSALIGEIRDSVQKGRLLSVDPSLHQTRTQLREWITMFYSGEMTADELWEKLKKLQEARPAP